MTPMDKNILESRILRIRKNLKELEKIQKLGEEEFGKDYASQAAAERLLEISIQSAIDIGAYLISERRLDPPTEYRQVFEILGKNNILNENLASAMALAAGLRNRLAHAYLDIDAQKIHQYLQSNLSDLEDFCREILKLIHSS